MKPTKKILVAPLNWGLGHAARCIPIIRELKNLGAEVIIAADGRALELLQKEFPELKCIRLPGSEIRYHEKGSLTLKLLLQLPQLIASVIKEHKQLKKIITEEEIDAVISDNRYGLYSKKIKSVLITHQTGIKLPKNIVWLESFINGINHYFMSKFDACWIPDFEGTDNLSGELSHKYPLPKNAIFIGPVSRFTCREEKKKYDLLLLLSGPEPQRTLLEKLLIEQLFQIETEFVHRNSNHPLKVFLVRGMAEGSNQAVSISENFTQVDYLLTEALNTAILSSEIIISRPGYTTIMDLATLGSKAIFIPTPGQTEQEYLAEYFKRRGFFYSEGQEGLDVWRALEAATEYRGVKINNEMGLKKILIVLLG
ncbi:MAG: glycosyltransferase [Chitinophagaceae bacterium]|nr:glycosyltransferase [Chitinophagaceae bacterium]